MKQVPRHHAAHALAILLALPATIAMAQRAPFGDGDDDHTEGLARLIQRLGTADAAAAELHRENYQLRDQRRTLKAEVDQLKGKVPAEGTVVLTAEQAAHWNQYQQLGKPEEITKGLESGKAAMEAAAKRDRADQVSQAAKAVGYQPEVLAQLAELHSMNVTSQSISTDGKPNTVYYVAKDGSQPIELTKYAAENWAAFMPSLQASSGQQQGQGGHGQGQQQQGQPAPGQQQGQGTGQQQGQPWINTGTSGGQGGQGGTGSTVADMAMKLVADRAAKPAEGTTAAKSGHLPTTNGVPG